VYGAYTSGASAELGPVATIKMFFLQILYRQHGLGGASFVPHLAGKDVKPPVRLIAAPHSRLPLASSANNYARLHDKMAECLREPGLWLAIVCLCSTLPFLDA